MILRPDSIHDKVEFFQAKSLADLENRIAAKIDANTALLLEVHHVSHQLTFDPESGKPYYTASVHFKAKK
ncbi:DUF2536 family protein [Paenalkalicoccus suaedae]|uniref:DUF2536 family protein n=1 Tax=Paenalkalicoccus suaedae TaxID=2592382 RepID=UPI00201C1420|nr:DUF2536 family protein [Paenalkalicoccus suaedae]